MCLLVSQRSAAHVNKRRRSLSTTFEDQLQLKYRANDASSTALPPSVPAAAAAAADEGRRPLKVGVLASQLTSDMYLRRLSTDGTEALIAATSFFGTVSLVFVAPCGMYGFVEGMCSVQYKFRCYQMDAH